jgi:predicted transposase/invertase (TIGR01784 family)
MSRYLDPKADVVFKKIFYDHPRLLISFLNAVLPLPKDGLIENLEYLPSEQVPVIPAFKSSIVDVRCTDQQGRVFVVEMQIEWVNNFIQRMLFNTSKAYVQQLEKGEDYALLKPVYGLALLNSSFDKDPDHWYHHYKIVNVQKTYKEIKDLQLVFVELPKFKACNLAEKKLQVLWLRFMSEMNNKTREAPPELLEVEEIRRAVELTEEAAYTPAELEAYDRYWDHVSTTKTLFSGAEERGEVRGKETGRAERNIEIARNMLAKRMSLEEIAELTGLSLEEVRALQLQR